jgi:hypothetical protein
LALQLRFNLLRMNKSPNFVAIMAILTEMARRLNENISKVELKPLQPFASVARPNQQS